MNALLTSCSSTKFWLCLPHCAMPSNRLVLKNAAAGELPLHSVLFCLLFEVSKKLKPLHSQPLKY